MRVGVFFGDYSPADGGGYTFQTETIKALARLADETAHEFVLISSQPQELAALVAGTDLKTMTHPGSGALENLKIAFARGLSTLRKRGWLKTALDRALQAEGIEFVWFTDPRPVEINIPFMTIVWDLQHRLQPWFPEVGNKAEWMTREASFSQFLPRASYIISGQAAGKKEIELFYGVPEWRIKLLPHPTPSFALDAETQPRTMLDRFDLPERFLLYPAQFWAHKNHANLLHALQHLSDVHGEDYHLALVGADHGNRVYVQRLAGELGVPDLVHFLGFVSIEELVALYQHAHALTYVTMFGPENLPPLEAMGLGCPVVATNVSGAAEQFGDAAILVEATSPESIAAGVMRLQTEAGLREGLIERGKARAASFTIDDFVRGVYAILDEFEPYRRTWRN